MMKKKKIVVILAAALAAGQLLSGCGSDPAKTPDEADGASKEAQSISEESPEEVNTEDLDLSLLATADDMSEQVEIGDPDMVPVSGDKLKDGVYDVDVECSSTMFNVVECQLSVENGSMTAVMTMSGTGYEYVYMGTGMDAIQTDEANYIEPVEDEDGAHTFTVAVEALDQQLNCTAFSKNKQKWYDRQLIFRADSLPLEAFQDGVVKTIADLELEDGDYTVDVELYGANGTTSITSPAAMKVKDGEAVATIIWNSSNYDYMKIGDVQYDQLPSDGNSVFEIPVTVIDWRMAVIADTVAMGTPMEMEYSLYFDSASITLKD